MNAFIHIFKQYECIYTYIFKQFQYKSYINILYYICDSN